MIIYYLGNYIPIDTNCHSERSEDVLLSEAKNLEYIKWVFSRSFLPSVVWMTPCGNLYIVPINSPKIKVSS